MSGPMVRALLNGTKTQTRRIVKSPTGTFNVNSMLNGPVCGLDVTDADGNTVKPLHSPYGYAGDRLWVRETCKAVELQDGTDGVHYVADGGFAPLLDAGEDDEPVLRWLNLFHYRKLRGATAPPIHMPRWASRILLEIVSVRVERLQDISEADAWAEGYSFQGFYELLDEADQEGFDLLNEDYDEFAARKGFSYQREWYRMLWQHINGPDSWQANPWVWVITFQRV